MLKSELFKILEANIIDKENEEEVRFLLSLFKEETRVLLLNLEFGKELLDFFKENRNDSKYQEFLSNINIINDVDVLQELYNIYNAEILLSSKYHAKVFEIAKEINISFLLEKFYDLATDIELLKSEHYEYVIENAKDIESFDKFDSYYAIATDENLLKSEHYLFAINEALKIKSPKKLAILIALFVNKNLLESKYYKEVIYMGLEFMNYQLYEEFKDLAINTRLLNHENYMDILKLSISIIDSRILELFYDLATDPKLMSSKRYLEFLKTSTSIRDLKQFDAYQKIVREIPNSKKLDLAIKAVLSIDNPKILSSLSRILTIEKLLEKDSFDKVITLIINQNNFEEYEFLISKITDIKFLNSKNFDYAIDLIYKRIEKVKGGFNKKPGLEYITNEKQEKFNVLDLFIALVTDYDLALSVKYKNIVDYAYGIQDYHYLLDYKKLVCSKGFLKSLRQTEIIDNIKKKPSNSLINLYSCCFKIEDQVLRGEFINKISTIDMNDTVYNKIINILDITFENKKQLNDEDSFIYEAILKTLEIKDEEYVSSILDEIKAKIEIECQRMKYGSKFSNFENEVNSVIDDKKVVNIIRKKTLAEIKESLKSIPDDVDINPDSFVKRIKKEN